MVDQPVRRSRRLRELSPTSAEPSSRRHRRNSSSHFQSMASDVMEIDPLVQAIVSHNRPSVSRDLERNTLFLSRVLFQSEDIIEVGELLESPETFSSPLPPDHP